MRCISGIGHGLSSIEISHFVSPIFDGFNIAGKT
jgi:hypothetical protein